MNVKKQGFRIIETSKDADGSFEFNGGVQYHHLVEKQEKTADIQEDKSTGSSPLQDNLEFCAHLQQANRQYMRDVKKTFEKNREELLKNLSSMAQHCRPHSK